MKKIFSVLFLFFSVGLIGQISISPNNGCAGSSFTITITGINTTVTSSCSSVGTVTPSITVAGITATNVAAISTGLANGSTTATLTIPSGSSQGTFGVTVSNSCFNAANQSCNSCFTINPPAPTSANISPSGNQELCSGQNLPMSCSAPGATGFQWKFNNVNISGATTQNYTALSAGTYTCVASNSCGSVTSSNSTIVSFVPQLTNVLVNPGGTLSICNGTSTTLTCNTVGATSYQWLLNGNPIQGEVNPTYSATAAGTYTVTAINSCGSVLSSNDLVLSLVSQPVAPNLVSSQGDTICPGTTTSITPGSGFTSYSWNNGETGSSITVTLSTTSSPYLCTVTSTCGTVASTPLTVYTYSTVQPTITQTLVLNANHPNATEYQWFFNNSAVAGATLNTLGVLGGGSYVVRVKDGNGCFIESEPYIIMNLNENFISDNLLSVFPNPSENLTSIRLENSKGFEWSISNLQGAVVLDGKTLEEETVVSVERLASGSYFVVVTNNDEKLIKRLFIQK